MLQLTNGHYFVDPEDYRKLEHLVYQVQARCDGEFILNNDASYLTYEEIYGFFTEIFYRQMENEPEKSDHFKRFQDEGMLAFRRYLEDIRTILNTHHLTYTESESNTKNKWHNRPKGEGFSATSLC